MGKLMTSRRRGAAPRATTDRNSFLRGSDQVTGGDHSGWMYCEGGSERGQCGVMGCGVA